MNSLGEDALSAPGRPSGLISPIPATPSMGLSLSRVNQDNPPGKPISGINGEPWIQHHGKKMAERERCRLPGEDEVPMNMTAIEDCVRHQEAVGDGYS